MRLIILTLFSGVLLAGCGKKGPLYLPEDEPKQTQTQQTESAPQNFKFNP